MKINNKYKFGQNQAYKPNTFMQYTHT